MQQPAEKSPHAKPSTRQREEIDRRYHWKLSDIFADWSAWEAGYAKLEQMIEAYAALRGTLAEGGDRLLAALELADELGQLSYKVWFYPSLMHDEDQRKNEINARRQQVQILLARAAQASAWFNPELLAIPLETVQGWLAADDKLAVYRFALEDLYRQQEHVLDQSGEQLLSFSTQHNHSPGEIYAALSTADMRFPTITLQSGEEVKVSHGQYRAILATNRNQADRAAAFEALYRCYEANVNTYAAIYNGVTQADWFVARARNYPSTLGAALHGNNIPVEVVSTLIETTREGTAPLRRYHQLRKRALKLDHYHLYDGSVPLVSFDRKYYYDEILPWIVESVAPLGDAYQQRMRRAVEGGWIDVYENEGKRSGAYSAGVYGVHPYMLLNYNDTLDDLFTTAHELGHTLHTMLSHEHQPFCYASYTIFVAEVASTLNEALLLEHLLARSEDPAERAVLLQHAVDSIVGTFYTQVLFASWELEAHRIVERDQPVTSDSLSELYLKLLSEYYQDAVEIDDLYRYTWARIPHFYRSPYYVYQYATCFASSAAILSALEGDRDDTVERYLRLLKSGGSDHPMELLRAAGVDLAERHTVAQVATQLDSLVGRLEAELTALGAL